MILGLDLTKPKPYRRAVTTEEERAALRELRTKLKLTQERLAHEMGVTVSTVNRWERGHARPSPMIWTALRHFAAVHHVPWSGAGLRIAYPRRRAHNGHA